MNDRDDFNYKRYHDGKRNLYDGVRRYWEEQTGEQWVPFPVEQRKSREMVQDRWRGVPPMYSAEAWRELGARWPDEVLRK